ncbi:PREDICTED: WW domain-binding protein 11-like [Prunus mume]|uniref:WW domain-binding protein 11-like n=1 Tax=Prunus mume TaxID=102107 RepID=A0ABM0NPX9_PRUMU|nr:PREDICTED: WW domain-binding protein 11-like [Prunus mume]
MSREARAIFSLLLMAACAATVLADVPPSPSPTITGLLPPGAPSFLPPGAPSFLPPGAPTIPGLLPPGVPSLLPPGTPSFLPPGVPGFLPPGIPGFLPPGIPGLFPPGKQGDIEAECWSSLEGIPGCVWEIYGSIFTGILSLGPACCKAFQSIDANCLAKLLPPFFPPLPQGDCAPGNVAASKAVGSKQ